MTWFKPEWNQVRGKPLKEWPPSCQIVERQIDHEKRTRSAQNQRSGHASSRKHRDHPAGTSELNTHLNNYWNYMALVRRRSPFYRLPYMKSDYPFALKNREADGILRFLAR